MRSRLWLCVGPTLFSALDIFLTLQGQPDAYWAGDYAQATELNPLALWQLRQHPPLFASLGTLWAAAALALVLFLPNAMARLFAFGIQIGHTLGAASWLVRHGFWGWLACFALLLLSREIMDRTWARASSSADSEASPA